MVPQVTLDFSEPLPLFALPQCLLLPHVTAPLYVFEPRYKRMVADVLDSHRLLAMAVFEGDRWKTEYQDSPPIRPCVCLARVLREDAMPGGRYNILVQGLCRANVVREVPSKPYRRAILRPVGVEAVMEIDLGDARRNLDSLLGDPLVQQLAAVNALRRALGSGTRTDVLIDVATVALCPDSEQRYQMLREPDVLTRGRWLEGYLRRTRRTLRSAARLGDGQTDEGWTLN